MKLCIQGCAKDAFQTSKMERFAAIVIICYYYMLYVICYIVIIVIVIIVANLSILDVCRDPGKSMD